MAKFTSNLVINTRWRNNDFIGAAGSSHTFPDAFYEEFLVDWAYQINLGNIVITETPTTGNIQMSTLTVGDIVLTGTATGNFGGGGTTIIGTSPISVSTSSNTSTISLNANYQTAGTYVTAVSGTAPITASGTTTITVGIDQSVLTVASAANAEVLRLYVKNTTGTTLNKGQPVYISGSDGNNANISLASATSDPTSSKTLGLLAQTLLTGEHGYVIENGLLTGIDTSTATAGQSVWLSATPGQVVYGTPPAEPAHGVYLGVVTRSQSVNGHIAVKVQNGYELDELHDVFVGGVSTALPLVYNSTSSGWIAQALSSVGIENNAIVTSKIFDAAVTSAKIADGAVGSAAIAAGSINSTHIGANAVVAGDIAANAVTSGNISAGAVGSSQLADNAVVAAKIASAAVGSAAIAASAVGSAAIAAGAVGTAAISSGAATSGQLLQADGLGAAIFATVPTSSAIVSISEYTASGTWTKPAGATAVYVFAVGGGAGGGSGGIGTTASGEAGQGGWGGSTAWRWISASSLSSSVSVTIGSGGTGAVGVSASTATNGLSGNAGGSTTFGTHLTAYGAPKTGTSANQSPFVPIGRIVEFGSISNNSQTDSSHSIAGTLQLSGTNVPYRALFTQDSAVSGLFTAGAPGLFSSITAAGAAGMDAAINTGGGGGGGRTATSVTSYAGGAGGRGFGQTGTAASGGNGSGGNGSNATLLGSGGGGGGSNINATGGAGGNGYRGGGGGGGGGVYRTAGTVTSGAGGNGGGGYMLVISI